jgi:hypothetical protein
MDLPNIKELEKLLKMVRKQGITSLTIGTMSFVLGDLPSEQEEITEEQAPQLSDEDLIYYSVMPQGNEQ